MISRIQKFILWANPHTDANLQQLLSQYELVNQKDDVLEVILETVADYFKMDTYHIRSKSRKTEHVKARFFYCLFAKEVTSQTLEQIGYIIGFRDHSTIIRAIETINDRLKYERDLQADRENLVVSVELVVNAFRNKNAPKQEPNRAMWC